MQYRPRFLASVLFLLSPHARNNFRRKILLTGCLLLTLLPAFGANAPMPREFRNAHSVSITSPSGDEFGQFPMPEDKEVVIATRAIIRQAHRLAITYIREQADLVLVVSGNARRDSIKVFGHGSHRKCVWHFSGKNALRGEARGARAFVSEFERVQGLKEIATGN